MVDSIEEHDVEHVLVVDHEATKRWACTSFSPRPSLPSTIHAPIDSVVREHARRVVADLGGNKAVAGRVLGIGPVRRADLQLSSTRVVCGVHLLP